MIEDSFEATYSIFMGVASGVEPTRYELTDTVPKNKVADAEYLTVSGYDAGTKHFIYRDVFYDRCSGDAHEVSFAVRLGVADPLSLANFLEGATHLG